MPAGTKKHTYQRIMKGFKLDGIWNQEHTKTFIALKACLVSEPVLSAPHYDGTPFMVNHRWMQGHFCRCAGAADYHNAARQKEGHMNAPNCICIPQSKVKNVDFFEMS